MMLAAPRPRTVLFVCSELWGAGPWVLLRRTCHYLPMYGWTCRLLLTGTKRKRMFDASGWPCEVEVITPSYSWIEHGRKVAKAISDSNPSVVLGTALHGPALAMRLLYETGDLRARLFDTVLSDVPFEYERIRMNADVLTMVGAISNSLAKRLRVEVPEVASRTGRILFPVTCLDSPNDRSQPDETIRLAYVGWIAQHDKRVLDFIPLVRLLLSNNLKFVLTFVGDGPQRNELFSAFEKIPGALERIRFLGWVPNEDVLQILREQDALVLMSEVEGQPQAVLEAMGSGVVPVASDLPGIREIVSDGESGFLVKQGKIETFADRLSQLSSDRTMLRRMSHAAWDTTRKQHSPDVAMSALAALLDLTSRAPLPPSSRASHSGLRLPSDNVMTRLRIPHSLQGVKRRILGQEIH